MLPPANFCRGTREEKKGMRTKENEDGEKSTKEGENEGGIKRFKKDME